MRVKFKKGKQREFIGKVIEQLNLVSLRSLLQYGFDVPYSTLKNYYVEDRTLPNEFFEQLCDLSKLNKKDFNYEIIEDNWGQVKGGMK